MRGATLAAAIADRRRRCSPPARCSIAGSHRLAHPRPPRQHRPPSSRAGAPTPGVCSRRPIGTPIGARERPQIAHVRPVDLDRDGLDRRDRVRHAANRVVWIRQSPRGTFTETASGRQVQAPAHAEAGGPRSGWRPRRARRQPRRAVSEQRADRRGGGARERRTRADSPIACSSKEIARVSDVRAGDLDGDGDLDLAVAQFGYNEGETRWMRNDGGWRFTSTMLQSLSGPINVEIADLDGDGDLDITSLVSQEWEEVYAYVNDGRGTIRVAADLGIDQRRFRIELAGGSRSRQGRRRRLRLQQRRRVRLFGRRRPALARRAVDREPRVADLRCPPHRRVLGRDRARSAADLDGDGDLDIAVVSAYNDWDSPAAQSLVWLENDGRQHFTLRPLAHRADAPDHARRCRSHRRRPCRSRDRRHAHEPAVRPHVADHAVAKVTSRAQAGPPTPPPVKRAAPSKRATAADSSARAPWRSSSTVALVGANWRGRDRAPASCRCLC